MPKREKLPQRKVEEKITSEPIAKVTTTPTTVTTPVEPLPKEIEQPPKASLKPCPMICKILKCKFYDQCWGSE